MTSTPEPINDSTGLTAVVTGGGTGTCRELTRVGRRRRIGPGRHGERTFEAIHPESRS